ncbi:MAG: radical SAM protein [Thermoplasmata archaeon]|nr:radical SAM protein [Thermoplasmata archaeon]
MKLTVVKASRALNPSRLPGLDYALNPYRGCSHACVYCYSSDVLRMDNWQNWGNFVEVRKNMPVLLAKQKKKMSGIVGLGTVTDPYQQAEEKHKITRYCLEQLAMSKISTCVQTKSDLIVRDIDILQRMKNVEVIFTINTMDMIIASMIEPGAPSPQRRVEALRQVSEAGIKTCVFLGPVIPQINDSSDSLKKVVQQVKDTGAGRLMYDRLRLKPQLEKRLRMLFGEEAGQIFRLAEDKDWYEKIGFEVEVLCDGVGLVVERAFG